MEEVTDEEIDKLERELKKLENKDTKYKPNNIEEAYLKAIISILLTKDIDYLDNLYRKIRG